MVVFADGFGGMIECRRTLIKQRHNDRHRAILALRMNRNASLAIEVRDEQRRVMSSFYEI